MDFKKAAVLSNYLSKSYAEDLFRLIVTYQDISASEAASRLEMHIRTVQEFLDTMVVFGILDKKEVNEKKRPYYRYSLKKKRIELIIDLEEEFEKDEKHRSEFKIRELKNSGAKFSIARNGEFFSAISIWTGDARAGKERKINLTNSQGKFLFFLPFPDADPLTIDEIIKRGNIDQIHRPEILNIVNELIDLKVIKKMN
jgi:predicted transcriptional regulator